MSTRCNLADSTQIVINRLVEPLGEQPGLDPVLDSLAVLDGTLLSLLAAETHAAVRAHTGDHRVRDGIQALAALMLTGPPHPPGLRSSPGSLTT